MIFSIAAIRTVRVYRLPMKHTTCILRYKGSLDRNRISTEGERERERERDAIWDARINASDVGTPARPMCPSVFPVFVVSTQSVSEQERKRGHRGWAPGMRMYVYVYIATRKRDACW